MNPDAERVATAVRAALLAEATVVLTPGELADDTSLKDGLRMTSLGLLRAMVELEDELDARFPGAAFAQEQFRTVGDVVAYVRKALAGPAVSRIFSRTD